MCPYRCTALHHTLKCWPQISALLFREPVALDAHLTNTERLFATLLAPHPDFEHTILEGTWRDYCHHNKSVHSSSHSVD